MARKKVNIIDQIKGNAQDVYDKINRRRKPKMKIPVRSISNVAFRPRVGYFELKGNVKERTLTVNTVKTFAQTLKMMALSKELIKNDDIATKREAYYISKNWAEAVKRYCFWGLSSSFSWISGCCCLGCCRGLGFPPSAFLAIGINGRAPNGSNPRKIRNRSQ